MKDIELVLLDWTEAAPRAMPLRERVFVVEQGVPAEMEMDEYDSLSRHALALAEHGQVLATGRLLPDGHVGRMAVDAAWRGRGIGGLVLETLVEEAWRRNMREVVLNAQVSAIDFYVRHGFVAEGETFMDAGIVHRRMRRRRSDA
ncbi:MAG: GNAT family N-acetyltransferase [Betaproteobacteria bacterium HGW-Betaproteobacteria-13]|jgi:predicted GNAT family N-acyltransferase|uniref:GNAT family N-acetyltransferase n=1 Tax=Parazoarcus communis TaxID=41977 RepID=A0A2U8H5D5_9RHOO|nr:GNAT family N-acetyltransferase [Parazoarcus communis]AWI80853.1 GNAT family N-acetyltransferase [Parazoarcus communis]PKO80993.1 MAG: GNAT family N-acetyltransferase [Betaproteobacteria bacterium HGW-Betaproteobacteria-13]